MRPAISCSRRRLPLGLNGPARFIAPVLVARNHSNQTDLVDSLFRGMLLCSCHNFVSPPCSKGARQRWDYRKLTAANHERDARMSKEKTKPEIDLDALQRLTPSQQAAKLERSVQALREDLDELEKSQVVSQKVMDLEFCF